MKMIHVYGDDEHAALIFRTEYIGKSVIDVINTVFNSFSDGATSCKITLPNSDSYFIKLYEFGEIDVNFIKFVRTDIEDYGEIIRL